MQQGFGTYETSYRYRNIFTDEDYRVNSKIKRGEIYATHQDTYDSDIMFWYIQRPNSEQKYIDEKKERVLNHMKQLNPVSYVSAGITFENDLNMEELNNLESKYPDVEFIWAGIRTDSPDKEVMDLIGIQLLSSNGVHLDDGVEDKYRAFSLLKWLVNPVGSGNSELPIVAQAYELHYKSLLQYVIDREEAVDVIERRPWKNEFYQTALNYAEELGVKTYGVLVFAEAKDLIELVENEQIKLVEFNQALVSKRNIQ
ncbi:anti sigma factor C-terminal domain-containing protein [Sedimentibacter sp.]|uniref:anti sigma factor C-terminal domain-containing protein n=1 Tax=Sedimentibacter sp. TaxID=1960295 RepID=UPI0028B20E67|nr:anti sigma factor C-terminal domain-containing protein [Sedimentibacter sp.]